MRKSYLIIILSLIGAACLFISAGQEMTGIAKVFDNSLIGKKLATGILYNPEDPVASSNVFELYSVLMIENLNNGKKTVVYVADNSKPASKEKDVIVYLSKRVFVELGEAASDQFPSKITLLRKASPDELKFGSTEGQQTDQTTANSSQTVQNTTVNTSNDSGDQQLIYYIQVGVYSKIANSDKVREQLLIYGFQVIVKESTLNNKKVYKVLVGPYSYEKAKEVRKILVNLGYTDCFITK